MLMKNIVFWAPCIAPETAQFAFRRKAKKEKSQVIYKRGKYYWYSFMHRGRRIQQSSKHTSARAARNTEAKHRAALADGKPFGADDAIPGFKVAMRAFLEAAALEHRDHP